MKGRARSEEEVQFHNRVAALGCIACKKEGIFNTYVSIHHVHGRTRPDAHLHVLPLCFQHHQGDGTTLAVHQNKAQWEARFGKQDDLIREVYDILGLPYSPPGKKVSKKKVEKPLVEGTALKKSKPKKTNIPKQKIPSPVPRSIKSDGQMAKRKLPSRKLAKAAFPKASKSTLPSSSLPREPTKAELEYRDQQKEIQKRMRQEAKKKYERENEDRIQAEKEKARLRRKEFRQMMKEKRGN